ncbi:MAG: hypothetical protein LBR40_01445 [Bacilli bacterium]|nr:hypothetical protein [Bacilli bacterium]
MSIFQKEVIDGLGYDEKNNVAKLYIKDVLTFDQEEIHIQLLNAKLSNYLSFIINGELDSYIDSDDYDKEIIIDFISEPPKNVKEFLDYYHHSFKKNNIELKYTITSLKS